jgi:serine/threonine-protein kinase
MIGQNISHYKILEKLGEGGMGVVYKAQDTKLDRFVALKFLPERVTDSEQDRARFLQEARAASALNHPNICTIHGIEENDAQMFIVMEWVDGQTLQERKHSVSPKQAIDIGIQISDGLAAAFEKGVVHRDIKPENIMIRRDGIVQVMDFGLAKLKGVSRITKEGSTVGTAGYMSPEQVQGLDADHRSDIFSLGVVLYELFAGELPFKGVHETALMYEIVNVDAPPMSTLRPDIDPELDRVVLECLQKEPSERYQSAGDVSKDLKRFKRESGRQRVSRIASHTPVSRSVSVSDQPTRRRSWLWPSVTLVLGAVVVFLLLQLWRIKTAPPLPSGHFTIELPEDAMAFGSGTSLAVSPDGRFLVYEGAPPTTDLFLRPMDRYEVVRLAGTENGAYPAFSPDGQWIAFESANELKKISVAGGAPQKICRVIGQIRGMHWGSDNNFYFGHIQNGIFSVPADGGEARLVTTMDSASGEISHRFPQLLPDERTVLFTIKQNNMATFDDALIAVQRLGSDERKVLIHGGTYARYVPTGHIIYVRGNSILGVPYDPDREEVSGSPAVLVEGGWLNEASGDAKYGVTHAGQLAYVPLGKQAFNVNTVNWFDPVSGLQSILTEPKAYFSATLSPDGQKFSLNINAANDDIWVYHIARQTLTRLTFGGGNHSDPVWSPDGRFVYYFSESGRSGSICRKPWDGSGEEEILADIGGAKPTGISRDGKNLIFQRDGDIWVLPLDVKDEPWNFTQSAATEWGVLSPDGNYLSYESNESGAFEIYVAPFPAKGGKWQISRGGGRTPLWSRNGRKLFYQQNRSMMAVTLSGGSSFDFSSPVVFCELPPTSVPFDISPDEKRLLVITYETGSISTRKINIITDWFQEIRNTFRVK